MSLLDAGGPLVLKLILEIVMGVDNITLRLLTHSLQMLQMKDALGENVDMVVSYLREL